MNYSYAQQLELSQEYNVGTKQTIEEYIAQFQLYKVEAHATWSNILFKDTDIIQLYKENDKYKI